MSHNVNISDVKITDITMLQAAVNELSGEGVQVELVKNDTMRGYKSYYRDNSVQCDYVLKFPNYSYDIGLNFDKASNAYIPVVEYGAHYPGVGAAHDAKTVEGKACYGAAEAAMLGRLTQRMNVIKAEIEATQQGYTASREMAPGGIINVVVNVA